MTATDAAVPDVPATLVAHLVSWVGGWPPALPPHLVGNPRNAAPGWDGSIRAVNGIVDAAGRVLVGVPPADEAGVRAAAIDDLDTLRTQLPIVLGQPHARVFLGVFRWCTEPAPLPDAGVWLDVADARVPPWLKPFGGEVLVALDDDTYVAGVGIKKHDAYGQEVAVVTEEAARGRGLARRLVAQAARRIVDEGAVATYLHGPDNHASAHVADAAGFPDRGWQILGMFEGTPS